MPTKLKRQASCLKTKNKVRVSINDHLYSTFHVRTLSSMVTLEKYQDDCFEVAKRFGVTFPLAASSKSRLLAMLRDFSNIVALNKFVFFLYWEKLRQSQNQNHFSLLGFCILYKT